MRIRGGPRVAATFRRGPLDGLTLPVKYPSRTRNLVFEARLKTRRVRAIYSASDRWGEWELAAATEVPLGPAENELKA